MAAGVFFGPIPSSQTVDVTASYQINGQVRIHGVATNLFDQRRYQIYWGSLISRRAFGGITGFNDIAQGRLAVWSGLVRIVPYPACELPETARVPSSHWLDASSTPRHTWDRGKQIPS